MFTRIIRNNKKIYIYFSIYLFQKSIFFPNLALTGSFSILRCIVGYLYRKIGQKSLSDKRILQYPFKNFCCTKYVEKQCLDIFSPPPPSAHFSSFFIEEIATPRRKLTEFAHTLLQEAVTYRPPITIDSTVTNQPPKLREQSRTPAINYHRLSSTIRSLPLFDYRTPRTTLESLHPFENILFEFTFDLRFKDKS